MGKGGGGYLQTTFLIAKNFLLQLHKRNFKDSRNNLVMSMQSITWQLWVQVYLNIFGHVYLHIPKLDLNN